MHQGQQPAFLVAAALGAPWDPGAIRLWLPLSPAEVAAARGIVAAAVPAAAHGPRVGFFAHATGLKALGQEWWSRFWPAFLSLHPDAVPLEFLPGAAATPTMPGFATLNLPSQRQLTAVISTLQLFISADAGPMHLASTTDTPTMGLFKVTNPTLYGPLKATDLSIQLAGRTPEEVAALVSAAFRAR